MPRRRNRPTRPFGGDHGAEIIKRLSEAQISMAVEGGQSRPAGELARIMVNGRLIHSDYDKWEDIDKDAWLAASLAMLQSHDKFRRLLWHVRACLIDLKGEGVLPELQYSATVAEDIMSSDGQVRELPNPDSSSE